ncbi:hypothetical protein N7G274_010895 [Stereocaulon virgatum]|uniref:Uncharacterized protein n=1 Tax=Stereocaulon virgatum TaxID=373712 RepID=A0ABR3ZTE8_9LECA
MSMSKSDDTSAFTAIELRAAGSDEGERTKPFESQDNVALARTGKKPVLKNTGNWFGKTEVLPG